MNFQEIKNKYPLAYNKLVSEYEKDIYKDFQIKNNYSDKRIFEIKEHDMQDDICNCDLTRFFDEQGIIISIDYDRDNEWFTFGIDFKLYNEKLYVGYEAIKTRPEAEEKAFMKGFEILEEKINEPIMIEGYRNKWQKFWCELSLKLFGKCRIK
jgi:hypothetical protein